MSNEPNKSGTKPAIQHSKSILDDRRIRLLLARVFSPLSRTPDQSG